MPRGAPTPSSAPRFSTVCSVPQGPTPSAVRWHRRKPKRRRSAFVCHASLHQRPSSAAHTARPARCHPASIHISDGTLHDVNVLDMLAFEAGAFYVMDRGYVDFARLYGVIVSFQQIDTVTRCRRPASRDCTRAGGGAFASSCRGSTFRRRACQSAKEIRLPHGALFGVPLLFFKFTR